MFILEIIFEIVALIVQFQFRFSTWFVLVWTWADLPEFEFNLASKSSWIKLSLGKWSWISTRVDSKHFDMKSQLVWIWSWTDFTLDFKEGPQHFRPLSWGSCQRDFFQLQDLETGDFLRSDAKDGKQGATIQTMKHDKYLQKKLAYFRRRITWIYSIWDVGALHLGSRWVPYHDLRYRKTTNSWILLTSLFLAETSTIIKSTFHEWVPTRFAQHLCSPGKKHAATQCWDVAVFLPPLAPPWSCLLSASVLAGWFWWPPVLDVSPMFRKNHMIFNM